MITDLTPYPEYKDSGVEWLKQVPSHWDVRRLRTSITDCVNGVWGAEPNGDDDLICVRVADFDRVNRRVSLTKRTIRAIPPSARSRRLLQKGDLLLEKSGGGDLQPVGAVVVYDHDEQAVCSNFIARMPMATGYNGYFANYLHSTLYANGVNLRSIKQTTGIQNLDSTAYLSELVAFPPTDEQAAIVRFLDWATGRLERAVVAKRKVIALLNEQKQAIIQQAVTRGLDPTVPLKPSGIPWLGDIPAHWEVRRAKYIYREVDERSIGGSEELLSVSHITGVTPRSQKIVTMFKAASYAGHKLCQPGDLVVNTMWAWMGALGVSAYVGLVSPSYAVYRPWPSSDIVTDYVDHLLRTRPYISNIICRSTGLHASRLRLYPDEFLRLPIVLPPQTEQQFIISRIERDTADIRATIARLEREIALLREYRTCLVSDVVTGKLDVREAATRLPDDAFSADDSGDALLDAELALEDEEVAV